MIIVLADDITGAAEIAGTALRYGLSTSLITDARAAHLPCSDVVVVATDIRSMPREEALREVESFCELFVRERQKLPMGGELVLFKKTDSVLRGHIRLELETLMERLNYSRALLVAQNPSKERVIDHGVYYVKGQRLSDTLFACDPEYPATTSSAANLLGGGVQSLGVGEPLPKGGNTICVADATSTEEVAMQVAKADKDTLVAGGADCFCAFLMAAGFSESLESSENCEDSETSQSLRTALTNSVNPLLVVCGSTQSKRIVDTPLMSARHAVEACLPDDVFEGAPTDEWICHIAAEYSRSPYYILRIGEHEIKGVEYAVRLKQVMAEATASLVANCQPASLVIEGGATAFAVLSQLGWSAFGVEQEFAPGVVGMRYGQTLVVLKPGSYPWGNLFA